MSTPALSGILEDLVELSASPAAARTTLTRLLEERPEVSDALARDEGLSSNLVKVVAASRSLGRLVVKDPAALDVLAGLDRGLKADASSPEALARWKSLELLRIAARDLGGIDPLEKVGDELSQLAEAVLAGSCLLADPRIAERVCVVGMGKLGGEELNYASDIDVVFAGGAGSEHDERAVRRLISIARLGYRVDADLRPEGRDGPLVRSVDSYQRYWQRWAQTWEIQALIKARA
ncbi:MAG: bifunctional [glutamine synthetase] adenylyltransferase/[glutamine synthetase]-adenylyl-L-tyrosine phosphorylase, partial [Thermoplasmata archaeon]